MAAAATPRAGGGDHGLDGSPQAPPPGPRPEGTKEADEPEGEGGSRHSPLPAAAAVDEMTALSSGRDPTLGPFSHPEYGSSSEGRGVGGGFKAAVSRPPLPLQAEPSCGAGLPAHRSCHLRPPWRLPCLSSRVLVEFRGEGSRCLLSLLWSSPLSGWCCPLLPRIFGAHLSVFFCWLFL